MKEQRCCDALGDKWFQRGVCCGGLRDMCEKSTLVTFFVGEIKVTEHVWKTWLYLPKKTITENAKVMLLTINVKLFPRLLVIL